MSQQNRKGKKKKQYPDNQVRFTLNVNQKRLDALMNLAKTQGNTRNKVINLAIADYIQTYADTEKDPAA